MYFPNRYYIYNGIILIWNIQKYTIKLSNELKIEC